MSKDLDKAKKGLKKFDLTTFLKNMPKKSEVHCYFTEEEPMYDAWRDRFATRTTIREDLRM